MIANAVLCHPAAVTSESKATAAEEDLFGGVFRVNKGWAKHEFADMQAGFLGVLRKLPRNLGSVAAMARTARPRALPLLLACEVAVGILAAFGLLAVNQVMNHLLGGGDIAERMRAALPALIAVGVLGVLGSLARAGSTAISGSLRPRVERLACQRLLSAASRVEQPVIEDSEFQDLLESAKQGASACERLVQLGGQILRALIGMIAAGSVITVLHPALFPLLLLVIVPRTWGTIRNSRRRFHSLKIFIEQLRRQSTVADLLTERDGSEEIRVHGAGPWLLDKFASISEAGERERARLARAEALTGLVTGAASGLALLLTYGALALMLATGEVELAAAGTALLAIRTGTAELGQFVDSTNQLYEDGLWVEDLEQVVREGERRAIPSGGTEVAERPTVITAQDITFRYPKAEKPALEGVSVEIRRGSVVAFVGANGSGKTTLAKLLVGLYQPDSGTVTWDGTDLQELDRAQAFDRSALIPQDFRRWPFTFRSNLVIGRPSAEPDGAALRKAIEAAGADEVLETLPHGWNTLLGRGYERAHQLSGGQWQRVALARGGWYRDAPLVIADEPTAALDPRAEARAFDQLRELAEQDRALILITHRLASVRHADHIYVLKHGRVIEHGNHQQLITQDAEYAEMFRLQASQYEATEALEA
jgi:ATP-binding cassette subfamily B protein